MKKFRSYKSSYAKYKAKFQIEKKRNNVKIGARQLTEKQYNKLRNAGNSDKDIYKVQLKLSTKALERKTWSDYKKLIKQQNLQPGEKSLYEDEGTYWGESQEQEEGLRYHRTLEGLLSDRHALHFLISDRIINGEDREEVLDDYGY